MILLVEDDRTQWELLSRRLETEGFETCVAENGVEALKCLMADDSIRLMITDIEMPRMDGIELMKTVRQSSALSSLPIIAISAYRSVRDNGAVLDAGANYFVAKPLDYDALLEYVRQFSTPSLV